MMMHHAHPSSPATEARLSFTSAVKNPVSVHTAGNFLASADRGFVTIFSLSAGTSRDILMACDGVHISAFSVLSVSTKSEIDGEHVMLNQSQGPQVPNSEIICHQLFFSAVPPRHRLARNTLCLYNVRMRGIQLRGA